MDLIARQRSRIIQDEALKLGFDDVGYMSAGHLEKEEGFLKKWLARGFHAGMDYMQRNIEKRNHPALLVEGAKSVIVVLQNYNPPEEVRLSSGLKLARYAYGRDYHKVLKNRMKKLMNFIQEEISGNITGRFFVDSAPVSERSLAVRAGLGWQGKNTNLIHPRMGSYVFIGEIILNVELIPGNLMNEACGTCTRCIDACPTGALVDSYQLDSNKCISYLTIENKGDISAELSPKYDEWFFGCDICQEVCPWNKNAPPHHESDFNLRHEFRDMTREQWLAIDKTDFDEISKGSPIRRAGYEGLIRNLKAALKTE